MPNLSANTFADSLNGLFKDTWASKMDNLIPEGLKLFKLINFLPKDKQPGNLYH